MEPLYVPNTAVVVQEINYDDIKKGMTVVYVKNNGRRVAHSVVGETRGGFLVQGVNNDEEDAELVTPENFIGVITQAFASAGLGLPHRDHAAPRRQGQDSRQRPHLRNKPPEIRW